MAQYWSGTTCDLYIKEEDFKYVNKEHVICIMVLIFISIIFH